MKNFNKPKKESPKISRLRRRIKEKEIRIAIDGNNIYLWNYDRHQFPAMVIRFAENAEKKALISRKKK